MKFWLPLDIISLLIFFLFLNLQSQKKIKERKNGKANHHSGANSSLMNGVVAPKHVANGVISQEGQVSVYSVRKKRIKKKSFDVYKEKKLHGKIKNIRFFRWEEITLERSPAGNPTLPTEVRWGHAHRRDETADPSKTYNSSYSNG